MAFANNIKYENIELETTSEDETQSSIANNLCCCEYINKDNQRFHLLACCCNCYDLDLAFTHLVCCDSIESHFMKNMLLTFQDRLRIPWRGGAKQIALDIWFSALAVAMILTIAAINIYTAIIMIVTSILVISYSYYYVKRSQIKTRMFTYCLVCSLIYMSILLESAIPLLEILPEEHFILVILAGVSTYCLWATHARSRLNFVFQNSVNDLTGTSEGTTAEKQAIENATHTAVIMECSDSSSTTNGNIKICNTCHKHVAARTVHCQLCGACILQQSHHSYWLNCCIGQWNYCYYMGGICFGIMTLILCANLTLTAICHPYIVIRFFNIVVMLPDDCSEVFSEYVLGLSFIMAVYALIMALYLLVTLLKQVFHSTRNSNVYVTDEQKKFTPIKKWKDILF